MPKQGKTGQKKSTKILPKTMLTLSLLRYGYTQKELAKSLDMSRQGVAYHINKLKQKKLIYDATKGSNKWKFYNVTELGQKVLVQYERHEKKELKGIENARWKCQIRNTKRLQTFLFENGFKVHDMENWQQWIGEIQGFSIAVNQGRITNLIITHPPTYSGDIQSAFQKANENILTVVSVLNKKWNLNLTIPEPVSGRQFTMANGIADYLMQVSSGSQVKLKNGRISIDASKGGEPRWEDSDLKEFNEFAELPDNVKELQNQIQETNKRLEQQNSVIMEALSTLMKQNETTNNVLTSLMDMQNQGKTGQKDEQKEFTDRFGMFG